MSKRNHSLPTESIHCSMCGKVIEQSPRAGKPKQYCSSSCKQAAYRKSKGATVANRQSGQTVDNEQLQLGGVPVCAADGCELPAEPGKRNRRFKMYCSDAHKQKALRVRRLNALKNRNRSLPTKPNLLYLRKGRGVIYLAINPAVTFCGRDASGMEVVGSDTGAKLCNRCQKTRDETTWWIGWRDAFGT